MSTSTNTVRLLESPEQFMIAEGILESVLMVQITEELAKFEAAVAVVDDQISLTKQLNTSLNSGCKDLAKVLGDAKTGRETTIHT